MPNFAKEIYWLQLHVNEIENICNILLSEARNYTLVGIRHLYILKVKILYYQCSEGKVMQMCRLNYTEI